MTPLFSINQGMRLKQNPKRKKRSKKYRGKRTRLRQREGHPNHNRSLKALAEMGNLQALEVVAETPPQALHQAVEMMEVEEVGRFLRRSQSLRSLRYIPK